MQFRFLLIGVLLVMQQTNFAQSGSSDLYTFKIRKITDNVYLAFRPEPLRKFVEGNVTIIINDKDVVLVDGGGSATSARNIIAEVKKLTANPIRYVINTHPHADHTLGNEEYVRTIPGVEIISHSYTRDDMIKNTPPYLESFSEKLDQRRNDELELIKDVTREAKPGYEKVVAHLARYIDQDIYVRQAEYAKLTVVPATLICDQKMTLIRGARTIEIMFLGHGDTPGDLVVYLPQDKVVCSGDMMTSPVPYGFSKEPLEWMKTLKKLMALDFDFLVPGHGALLVGKTYLQDVIELLQSVHTQVKAGIEKGETLETIRNNIELSAFSKKYLAGDPVALYRFRRWFANPAIERAYEIYHPEPVK